MWFVTSKYTGIPGYSLKNRPNSCSKRGVIAKRKLNSYIIEMSMFCDWPSLIDHGEPESENRFKKFNHLVLEIWLTGFQWMKNKISKNACHIRNFHIFLPRKHVLFAFCIFLSLNLGKTPTNSKFHDKLVRFGFSVFFYPGVIYHMYFSYSIYLSSKKLERLNKFEISWKTSHIRTLHVFLPGIDSYTGRWQS